VDVYSTHLALLEKAVSEFDGDIIECGCGKFSTKLLHEVAQNFGRKLYTLENDAEWLNITKQYFPETENHVYLQVNDGNWDEYRDLFMNHKWGVVFIDHENNRQKRGQTLEYFIKSADCVVLHDTEDVVNNGDDKVRAYSDELFSNWEKRIDDTSVFPNTTMLYNNKEKSIDKE